MPIISLKGKSSLTTEEKFFEKKKAELIRQFENKFVLIKKNAVLGTYNSKEEAYKEGLKKIGNKPMYIKRITRNEPIPMLVSLL